MACCIPGTAACFTITAFRPAKPGEAVIAFEGVRDRNAAEALKGTELFVARDALPAPDEDEFYHADLIGLEARDSEGRMLGKVAGRAQFRRQRRDRVGAPTATACIWPSPGRPCR